MKKVLALAGSNSSKSINFKLINYVASLIKEQEVKVLDIRKWDIPIYSEDMDADDFTPKEISDLIEIIKQYDAFIFSIPEHNGSTPAFFKNITDWLSRRSKNLMEDKPLLLLGTSTGRGAAAFSREYSERALPRLGVKVVASHGIPSFNYTMLEGKLVDEEQAKLDKAIALFQQVI